MSDVMLLGILRQPRECWSADPIFVMQQQNTCERAADRIEADAVTIARLEAALRKLTEWDAKYPKGREWQYGLSMQIEHELDAICDEARLALTNDAGEGA